MRAHLPVSADVCDFVEEACDDGVQFSVTLPCRQAASDEINVALIVCEGPVNHQGLQPWVDPDSAHSLKHSTQQIARLPHDAPIHRLL